MRLTVNTRVVKEYSCDFTAVLWNLYDILIATARTAALEKVSVIHISVYLSRESRGGIAKTEDMLQM